MATINGITLEVKQHDDLLFLNIKEVYTIFIFY
jgi:hypothetical protein